MKPIALLVWFYQGFQPMSVVIALINFAVIINLWITAKGFYISAWTIPMIGATIGVLCVVVGGFQHWINIQQRFFSVCDGESYPVIQTSPAVCSPR